MCDFMYTMYMTFRYYRKVLYFVKPENKFGIWPVFYNLRKLTYNKILIDTFKVFDISFLNPQCLNTC